MMHVSPCGWYCFKASEDKEKWEITDTQERTLIVPEDSECMIELLSARKATSASDDEISELHEIYLSEEKIHPLKTVLSENSFGVSFFVTQGTGPDERIWLVCHAFWNNYCVFIRYHGTHREDSNIQIQFFYDILNSLQPLTTA